MNVSPGDFVALGTLCWNLYKQCKESTGEFKQLTTDVSCLHSILKEAEELLSEQTLDPAQLTRLEPIKQGTTDLVQELETKLNRYESLGTQARRTLDRLGWAMDGGVQSLRQRIISQTTLLEAFINTTSQARLERKLNQLIAEVRAGRRQESVISSHTFDGNERETWRSLRRELEDVGISSAVIEERRDFLIAWFRDAVAAGRLDEEETEPSQAPIAVPPGSQRRPNPAAVPPRPKPSKNSTGKQPVRLSYLLDTLSPEKGVLNAAQKGDQKKFFYLIDRGADTKRVCELYRNRVLQLATIAGRGDLMIPLLKTKCDLNAVMPDLDNRTPSRYSATLLHLAARHGHSDIIKMLVENGANLEAKDRPYEHTVLQYAAKARKEGAIKTLLECGANVNSGCSLEKTALHTAVDETDNMLSIKALLEHGANPRAQDHNKDTPLHKASGHFYGEDAVILLIEHGATVNARNDDGETPLHKACGFIPDEKIVRTLLEHGAKLEEKDTSGQTALHIAASYGNESVCRILLEHGANFEERDTEGLKALHIAASHGNESICRILLEHGAEIEARDSDLYTPLHRAVFTPFGLSTVMMLVGRGANIRAKTSHGHTARDLAIGKGVEKWLGKNGG